MRDLLRLFILAQSLYQYRLHSLACQLDPPRWLPLRYLLQGFRFVPQPPRASRGAYLCPTRPHVDDHLVRCRCPGRATSHCPTCRCTCGHRATRRGHYPASYPGRSCRGTCACQATRITRFHAFLIARRVRCKCDHQRIQYYLGRASCSYASSRCRFALPMPNCRYRILATCFLGRRLGTRSRLATGNFPCLSCCPS